MMRPCSILELDHRCRISMPRCRCRIVLALLALTRAAASRSASIAPCSAIFSAYGQDARTPLRTM